MVKGRVIIQKRLKLFVVNNSRDVVSNLKREDSKIT